jgi:predicted transcriptional regulator
MSRLDVRVGGGFADAKGRVLNAVARAERDEVVGETQITIETWEALAAVMTPKRFELVRHLHRSPEASVAALARSLGRDDERVHEDVEALLAAGLVGRSEAELTAEYDEIPDPHRVVGGAA